MQDRESDIINLCQQVLNATPATYCNPNGADDTTCPFCRKQVYYAYADMSDIKHDINCAYILAKDLSTNLINHFHFTGSVSFLNLLRR